MRYNGPPNNNWDAATAIAVDNSGNIYVTGESYGIDTFDDYATIKYNSSGEEQWIARYNGTASNIDRATAIAVDQSGNVYVTGESQGSGSDYDYTTVKYNSAGQEQWAVRYNGPANSADYAKAIAVDSSGNVYVTGYSFTQLGSEMYDYTTIKYNSEGEEEWVICYNGPAGGQDEARDMALDASGNIYVTGRSYGGISYNNDYATVKYEQSAVTVEKNYTDDFRLLQNYPNPFHSGTTIPFEISQEAGVVLKVLNSLGQEVTILVDEIRQPGFYEETFSAGELPDGVYFCRLQAGSFIKTSKLILLR